MTTDNVLVSREKWEKMLESLAECDEAMGYMSEYDIPLCMPDRVKEALTMPDFIESERDVDKFASSIHEVDCCDVDGCCGSVPKDAYKKAVQAAINALRYRKDGE